MKSGVLVISAGLALYFIAMRKPEVERSAVRVEIKDPCFASDASPIAHQNCLNDGIPPTESAVYPLVRFDSDDPDAANQAQRIIDDCYETSERRNCEFIARGGDYFNKIEYIRTP